MIDSTAAYKAAVVGTTRRTKIDIVVDISDPDMVYTGVAAADQAGISVPGQLIDKQFDLSRYATLERNRWLLDGSFSIFEDDYSASGEIGGVSASICGDAGRYSASPWFEIQFTNVAVLQVCSVYFSGDIADGIPSDFTVSIMQGGTAFYTEAFTGNTENHVSISGFLVNYPDAIRITVTKWTTPHRRVRVVEIIPGVYEHWSDSRVTGLNIDMTADPSAISVPYGTCALTIDNTDRKFEPRNKSGLFQSLQERQSINVSIGVLVDGAYDYKRIGTFYQFSGGWKTSDNDTTIRWNLVDIIGLLSEREFVPPSTLPTTVTGWIEAILGMLGSNFSDRYTIDPSFANVGLTAQRSAVTGLKCGAMINYVCMACGAWARADATTGRLAIEPLWSQGNSLDLDNLERYPTIQANDDVAQIIFTLSDQSGTQYVVGGNSMTASKSISIQNPFISTSGQALTAAQNIIMHYGGDIYETTGRGNPTTEIGDVVTLALDESHATTGRVLSQTFSYSRQVLSGCATRMVQADGILTYTDRVEITTSGTWTVPTGVTSIRLILVGGGNGGKKGGNGSWDDAGADGDNGIGGAVWYGNINVTAGTSFAVTVGSGGAANGGIGTATTFGTYSSANGSVFDPSYTDVASGSAYGRTGVKNPLANTGDGGMGGEGGRAGKRHEKTWKDEDGFVHTKTVIDRYPEDGEAGKAGASGCVVIYYSEAGD